LEERKEKKAKISRGGIILKGAPSKIRNSGVEMWGY